MSSNYRRWQVLFLFCMGLFGASAFCMKWMESGFLQGGQPFTVIGLEIGYPREKVAVILAGLDDHVKTILRYHLNFDFVFMAGVYPGIAALCMMSKDKSGNAALRKILIVLAVLQIVAWGCDIFENGCLLKWIRDPDIGNEFRLYHLVVATKWIIALIGAFVAIPLAARRRKSGEQ